MSARERLVAAAAAFTAVALLAGCTGVPTTSSAEVVTSVGVAQPSQSLAVTPTFNGDPRTMVIDFLNASVTDDTQHRAAQGFLTPEAVQRWLSTTVTVVDTLQVSNFARGAVSVTGRKMGSLSASGIYTPVLQGDGGGDPGIPFTFGMKRINGQWRIDTLQNGVIIDYADFQRLYQQRSLYFFDSSEKKLVPDPRYTAISDPALLANWLALQLAAGPRLELQTSVSIELPAQTDPARITVTLESPAQVQVPGAAQLDPATRNRLAAQMSVTLQSVVPGGITIVDSGRAIDIPAVGGAVFTSSDFSASVNSTDVPPALFYLVNGKVVDVAGKPLPGGFGSGQYHLTSVGIARTGSSDLRVAGTTGAGVTARLLIGTLGTGLRDSGLRGALSRPSWAPGLDEAWVGVGSAVYRVTPSGRASPVTVSASTGAVKGRVSAIRFSPEGARVALVLTASDGSAQIWVGSVARSDTPSPQVRVDSLEPISPQGVVATDVAWNDQTKLFAIGHQLASGEANVYEVQVDGSLWKPRGIGNLPQAPDSITVAENELVWVSAGETVWALHAATWAGPANGSSSGSTDGTNPVYLE